MTSAWPVRRLDEVCSKIGGGATPRGGKSGYLTSGTALIRSQNVLDLGFSPAGLAHIDDSAAAVLAGAAVHDGDVLLNITGDSAGRCCVAPPGLPARVSQHVAILRPRPGLLDPEFLAACLVSPEPRNRLRALAAAGATRPALTRAQLRSLAVPVPPMRTQRAIGQVLGALGSKAAANDRLVPVLADLAAATLQRQAMPGQSFLVARVADVRKGLSYAGAGLARAGMPLTGRPMVTLASTGESGWLRRSGLKHYLGQFRPRHVAAPGSLLVAGVDLTWRLAIIGRPMILPGDIGPALFSHHVFLVDFRPEWAWLRLSLWAHLHRAGARARLTGMVGGTTVASLPAEALTGLEFPAVARDALSLRTAGDLLARAWAAERESERLIALRDALLPPLLSGRLPLRDAESAVADQV